MKKRLFLFILIFIILITNSLFAEYLDEALNKIFKQIKKEFTYTGEVVAVLPERNEAIVEFKNHLAKKGSEILVYRKKGPIINQITGKVIGHFEDRIGIISIKDIAGSVSIGDIVENKGIKPGDIAKYSRRVVFRLKAIENLSDKPLHAYKINSYLDLAISKYPEFELLPANQTGRPSKNEYFVNMKIYIKDAGNPKKKKISIKLSSYYTGYNIGLYTSEFDLNKNMLMYANITPSATTSSSNITSYPSYPTQGSYQPTQGFTNIPVYPMGPMNKQKTLPIQQYPAYPQYPNITNNKKTQPSVPKNYALTKKDKYSSQYSNTIKAKLPKSNILLPKAIGNYKTLVTLKEKIKKIDFKNNKFIYSDGYSIIYGKIGNSKFKKLSGDLYQGDGEIISLNFIDVDGDKNEDIVVNIKQKNKMASRIYKIKNNQLILILENLDYILSTFDFNNDGIEELAGQKFDKVNGITSLYELKLIGNKLEKVKKTWIPNDFNLLSSLKTDIDNDKQTELIYITKDNSLNIYKNGEKVYTLKISENILKSISKIEFNKNNFAVFSANNNFESIFKILYYDGTSYKIKKLSNKIKGKLIALKNYNKNYIWGALLKKTSDNPLVEKANTEIILLPIK